MMKNKAGIGVLVVLLGGYIFMAPYITAYQMKIAVEQHDAAALSGHVDFPAVRKNLKDQLNARLGKEMAKQMEDDNPFAALGATLGSVMVDKMVDVYVTPASISDMMRGEKPGSHSDDDRSTGTAHTEPDSETEMHYQSLGRFAITTRYVESGKEVTFVLRRSGIGWKLTEINLPASGGFGL